MAVIVTSPIDFVDLPAAKGIELVMNLHTQLLPLAINAGKLLSATFFLINPAVADYAVSDLLIVLDADGRTHTVQHTIASGGPAVELSLPGSVIPQEIMQFNHNQPQELKQTSVGSNLIVVENGSAFARYQHQYGAEVELLKPGHYTLTTASVPGNIKTDKDRLTRSAITWVFPTDFDITSYTVTDPAVGRWVSANNSLTYHQLGDSPVTLSISYENKTAETRADVPICSEIGPPTDACSKDADEDGVPDYRDICFGEPGDVSNKLGCVDNTHMVLSDVVFETGKTYLDVSARNNLDRVAYAILLDDDQYYEIGAHTDNVGGANSNQLLSQKRADAVRHYLMLRGVSPNALLSTGYGETYPIRDNESQDGRRANRRVELVLIAR